ncbi:MAG: hypothetical protein R3F39_02885 [Myxococcota bacterium]
MLRTLTVAVAALFAFPAVGCDGDTDDRTSNEAALTIDLNTANKVGDMAEIHLPIQLTLDAEYLRAYLAGQAGDIGAANPDWGKAGGASEPVIRIDADLVTPQVVGGLNDAELNSPMVTVRLLPGELTWQKETSRRSHIAQGLLHTLLHPVGYCASSDSQECVVHLEMVVQFDPSVTDMSAAAVAKVHVQMDSADNGVGAAPLVVAFE